MQKVDCIRKIFGCLQLLNLGQFHQGTDLRVLPELLENKLRYSLATISDTFQSSWQFRNFPILSLFSFHGFFLYILTHSNSDAFQYPWVTLKVRVWSNRIPPVFSCIGKLLYDTIVLQVIL